MRRMWTLIAGLVTFIVAPTAHSQVPCQAGLSLPAPAIVRNPLIFNTAADLGLAVGENRIALTSNDKVQLRCRSTGGNVAGTSTLPLRGATPAAGAFVTNPAIDEPDKPRRMFDPRVIYDNYDHRFWMVASTRSRQTQTSNPARFSARSRGRTTGASARFGLSTRCGPGRARARRRRACFSSTRSSRASRSP